MKTKRNGPIPEGHCRDCYDNIGHDTALGCYRRNCKCHTETNTDLQRLQNLQKNDFESYLQEMHAEDYHGVDDDMPDAFDAWVSELEVDDVIGYAEAWGHKLSTEAFDLGQMLEAQKHNPRNV